MYTRITAHSGAEGTEVDSLESIRHALNLKADALEIDVRLAKNGELRLSHNFCTSEEYEQKALVREAFEMIRDSSIMINCDLKEQQALYPLLDMAESFGLDKERLIITGCTALEQLLRDSTVKDRAKVIINVEEMLRTFYVERFGPVSFETMQVLCNNPWAPFRKNPALVDESMLYEAVTYIKKLGLFGLNTSYQFATEALIRILKEADIPLSVWTVNDAETAKVFFAAGAWNITTRQPRLLMGIRG